MSVATPYDVAANADTLLRDGIVGLQGAFPTALIDGLREDMERAYAEAIDRPGGAINRGPKRWYIEVHPEDLRGFPDDRQLTRGSSPWPRPCSGRTTSSSRSGSTAVPGRQEPAVAPRLPLAGGDLARPPDHLARVQPDGRGRRARHGTFRDRAGTQWEPRPRTGSTGCFRRRTSGPVTPPWRSASSRTRATSRAGRR